ncbi:hypothetical protein ZHAS_00018447 [Anopheles sinensis]|uniref:Uncharacterized protein n=1 Tax=Anopheles sinensis TaxID=74873 RepID=A0A084WJM5_ANOSI|nr:hypothetical protein ZHAS_00018447 [Anopheles sinensis]
MTHHMLQLQYHAEHELCELWTCRSVCWEATQTPLSFNPLDQPASSNRSRKTSALANRSGLPFLLCHCLPPADFLCSTLGY